MYVCCLLLYALTVRQPKDDEESLVQTLFSTGKFNEALDEINFMIKRSPRTGTLYLARIVILLSLADKKKVQLG